MDIVLNQARTRPCQNQPAAGRRISFNGMEGWMREGDQFVENRVFVDWLARCRATVA